MAYKKGGKEQSGQKGYGATGRARSKYISKKIAEEKAKSVVGLVKAAYFDYKDVRVEKEKFIRTRIMNEMRKEQNERKEIWTSDSENELRERVAKEAGANWKEYFPSYVRRVAPYFYFSRYHLFLMLMCQVAYEKACIKGENVVLAISCPPQTGKTEVEHLFATWLSMKYPDENVLMFSYGFTHAARIGLKMKNVVANVCGEFGLELANDKRATNNFGYSGRRGGIESMGIDGTSTGVGGTFKFIDDPLKDDEEAGNNTIRSKKWEYIEDKVMTRSNVLPNGGSITFYIMTRRHEDDPIGRLDEMWISKELSEDGFARKYCEYVRIPFICDDENTDPLGRKFGEALDNFAPKERGLGVDRARYIQATISGRRWLAQYQQRPTQEDGDVIKRDMFRIYDVLPKGFDKIVLSCDLSNDGGMKSDKTAFTLWGKLAENHYLIDFAEGKWSFSSQVAIISKYCEMYPINKVLVEKRATGTAMIDYLIKMLKVNVPIVGFEPKFSSKEARLDSVEPEFSGGYVWIPSEKLKPNIESGYISQMLAFPNGANDGLVDTTSQYLIDERMAKGGKIVNDTDWLGRIWRA